MSFLKLNGWAVATRSGGSRPDEEFGSRKAAYDGTPHVTIRRVKRAWRYATPPTGELTASAVAGLVRGDGDTFQLNGSTYSGKGLPADATANEAWHRVIGVDGYPAVDNVAGEQGKYGTYALGIYAGKTNLFSANIRNCENAPTGFHAYGGGTPSGDTANNFSGSRALKVVAAAGGQGAETDTMTLGAGSANKSYTISFWARGAGWLAVDARDLTNATTSSDSIELVAGTWKRFSMTATIGALDCTDFRVAMYSFGVCTYYFDCFQLEETVAGATMPSLWVDGARTTGKLEYSDIEWLQDGCDCTFMAWVGWPTAPAQRGRVFMLYLDATHLIRCCVTSSGNYIDIEAVNGGVSGQANYTTTHPWSATGVMVHIAWVVRASPETGEHELSIYLNGVLVAYADTDLCVPDLAGMTVLRIGADASGATPSSCPISDVVILPYAAPVAQVAAVAALAKYHSVLPQLYLDGDSVNNHEATVIGEVNDRDFTGYSDTAGAWHANGSTLDFKLRER